MNLALTILPKNLCGVWPFMELLFLSISFSVPSFFLSVLCGQLLMFFKIKFAYIRPYSRSFVTLLFFPLLTPFLCVERFCFCCAPCLRASVVSFGFTS